MNEWKYVSDVLGEAWAIRAQTLYDNEEYNISIFFVVLLSYGVT